MDAADASTAGDDLSRSTRVGTDLRALRCVPGYAATAVAAALHNISAYGAAIWLPPFLQRTHQMSTTEIGLWLAVTSVVGIALGTGLGGPLGDRLKARYGINPLWVPAVATILSIPFALAAYLSSSAGMTIILLIAPALLGASYIGPVFSMVQNSVPQRLRGLAASVVLFLAVMVGQGFGPQFIGLISDLLAGMGFGDLSLRWALVSTLLFNPLACVAFLLAIRAHGKNAG